MIWARLLHVNCMALGNLKNNKFINKIWKNKLKQYILIGF